MMNKVDKIYSVDTSEFQIILKVCLQAVYLVLLPPIRVSYSLLGDSKTQVWMWGGHAHNGTI